MFLKLWTEEEEASIHDWHFETECSYDFTNGKNTFITNAWKSDLQSKEFNRLNQSNISYNNVQSIEFNRLIDPEEFKILVKSDIDSISSDFRDIVIRKESLNPGDCEYPQCSTTANRRAQNVLLGTRIERRMGYGTIG